MYLAWRFLYDSLPCVGFQSSWNLSQGDAQCTIHCHSIALRCHVPTLHRRLAFSSWYNRWSARLKKSQQDPMIKLMIRVLAPSKQCLALGFLNHQQSPGPTSNISVESWNPIGYHQKQRSFRYYVFVYTYITCLF